VGDREGGHREATPARKRIEETRVEIEKVMRTGDLSRAAELQYGTLAQLERELKALEAQVPAGGGRRLIKEEWTRRTCRGRLALDRHPRQQS